MTFCVHNHTLNIATKSFVRLTQLAQNSMGKSDECAITEWVDNLGKWLISNSSI